MVFSQTVKQGMKDEQIKTQDWSFKQVVLKNLAATNTLVSSLGFNHFNKYEVKGAFMSVALLANLVMPYCPAEVKNTIHNKITELEKNFDKVGNYSGSDLTKLDHQETYAYKVSQLLSYVYMQLPNIGIRVTQKLDAELEDIDTEEY